MLWLVLTVMMVLLAAGTAVAYALGASSVLAFIASDNLRYLAIMPQRIFSQIDVFSLMAMPLFILAGEIMNRAGITRALVDFAMAMLGRLKGGLGHVNVLASVFFAGISGSAVADAAALGNTLVPAMVARGYSPLYAAAITVASSVIGPIIPPSIVMIFYGAVMQTSVAALFVAGVIPGLMLAGVLFAANAWFAHRDDHPGGRAEDVPPFWPALLARAARAVAAGDHHGWHRVRCRDPDRSRRLTVVAALAVGAWYGGMGKGALSESLVQTAALTGAIFMILGAVACFSWLAGHEQLPSRLASFVTELGLGRVEYLLVVNLIFVAAGMLLDPPVALALLVPLLGPPAIALGVDPVHLGIVLCLNLTIGLITPRWAAAC
jgi:tripartite ATP-independent transporter DctM subunit